MGGTIIRGSQGFKGSDYQLSEGHKEKIEVPSLNLQKQVGMYYKYCPIVPYQHHNNILYKKPSKEVIAVVKNEKKSCKDFKGELNRVKLLVKQRKDIIKIKLEKYTLGVDTGGGEKKSKKNETASRKKVEGKRVKTSKAKQGKLEIDELESDEGGTGGKNVE